MIWLIAFAGVWTAAWVAWLAWESHVRYGPICYGNARWRREAPLRAAEDERREAIRALTPDDREWLLAMGWRP